MYKCIHCEHRYGLIYTDHNVRTHMKETHNAWTMAGLPAEKNVEWVNE